jgi:large subunit ribosomal protein L17
MRHQKSGRALGIKPAHRHALMRNAVTSLLEHGRIRTTLTKAKELRGPLDHMITLGKRGDLSARRQALAFIKSKEAMKNLFGDLAERYKERPGGYSRILATGPRRGDAAPMAIMMLVDGAGDPFSETKAKRPPARRRRKTLDQVAEKVADTKPTHPGAKQ